VGGTTLLTESVGTWPWDSERGECQKKGGENEKKIENLRGGVKKKNQKDFHNSQKGEPKKET